MCMSSFVMKHKYNIYGFSQQMSDNGVLRRIYRCWFAAWQETSRVIEKLGGEGYYILFIF